MSEAAAQAVRSLLVPARPVDLLLPSSLIAEIARPQQFAAAADPLFGRLEWRGLHIPVLSLEMLVENRRSSMGPRSKIVVLYPRSAEHGDQFLGLLSDAEPHSRSVGREDLQAVPGSASGFVQAYVRLGEETAAIPNIDAIFEVAFG